jgi:Uma2 family endonuclease
MSTALKRLSIAEYLERERHAEFKSEYFDGEVFAMAVGSLNHSLIAANLIREIGSALKDRQCIFATSDLRVKVDATGLYTYPDATIVCGDLEFDDEKRDTVLNPTVLVEVLSESTEKYDRGRKSQHYRRIPSLKAMVSVSQEDFHVEWYTRESDSWLLNERTGLDQELDIQSLGIRISLAEIYRNVVITPAPTDTANRE